MQIKKSSSKWKDNFVIISEHFSWKFDDVDDGSGGGGGGGKGL